MPIGEKTEHRRVRRFIYSRERKRKLKKVPILTRPAFPRIGADQSEGFAEPPYRVLIG
jgi:hypothetical protein